MKCVCIEKDTFYDIFICHNSTNSFKQMRGLENIFEV